MAKSFRGLWLALALCAGLSAGAAQAEVKGITSPKEAFGHDIGEDYFLVDYSQAESYLKTLAGESDRMKLVDIGPTEEGRREYMAIVSSPANLKNLGRYQEIARKLAQAKGVSEDEARALALDTGRETALGLGRSVDPG